MLQETLKSKVLSLREQQELESLKRAIEESLNDPRPGIPHAQAMEELDRYVQERVQYYLEIKRAR